MTEHEERPFGWEHIQLYACHTGNAVSPDTCGVDDQPAMRLAVLTRMVVAQLHSLNASVPDNQACHLVISENIGPMTACIQDVRRCEMERVNGSIGHTHGPDKVGIDRRLYAACLFRRNDTGFYSCLPAGFNECRLIMDVVFGQRDEQAVRFFHTVMGYTSENHILLDTFGSRLRVGHGIARTAVQQTVIASCRSIGEIGLLYKQHTQSAQGAVACSAGTGNAPTDNNHIIVFV